MEVHFLYVLTLSLVHYLCFYTPLVQADVFIEDWYDTYNHTSQKDWNVTCRTGQNQSPINIRTDQVYTETLDRPLSFTGYEYAFAIQLEVNTHTIEGKIRPTSRDKDAAINSSHVWISGGGLGESKFQFHGFHFHWGSTKGQGSEHSINNSYYVMEMHLVHWNADARKNFTEAAKKGIKNNSLAVLAVLFEIGKKNEKLEPLLQKIKNLSKANRTDDLDQGMMLKDLLPENTNEFYRYHGSLTSPPCHEIVAWTVFKHPVSISFEQLGILREENDLSNNYRAIQYLNSRKVYFYTLNELRVQYIINNNLQKRKAKLIRKTPPKTNGTSGNGGPRIKNILLKIKNILLSIFIILRSNVYFI